MCVKIATGEVTLSATDLSLPNVIPFDFRRTYRSTSLKLGPLGYGWTHSLDQFIRFEKDRISMVGPEDELVTFDLIRQGEEAWAEPSTLGATKLERVDRNAIVTLPNQRRLIFSEPERGGALWQLQTIVDLNQNTIQYGYSPNELLSTVVDTHGRQLLLTYNHSRLLERIVVRPGSNSTQAVTLVRFHYNSDRDLVATYDPNGSPQLYEYHRHLLVRYTNRLGGNSYFEYSGSGQCVNTWMDDGRRFRTLEFDERKKTTSVTDSSGVRTIYRFNQAGLITERVDVVGNSKKTFYDPENRLLYSEDEDVSDGWVLDYNSSKRELRAISPAGAITTYTFNHLNRLVTLKDAEGNIWAYQHDERGNLVAALTPRGARWEYERDSTGLIASILDSCGRRTRIFRSADGSSVKQQDDLGSVCSFDYDFLGNLVRLTDESNRTTAFEYDSCRRLIRIIYPDKSTTSLVYDTQGNILRVVDGLGNSYRRTYDRYGRLVSAEDPLGHRFTVEYDSEERLTAAVNERGEQALYLYDALHRLSRLTLFDGQTESYEYTDDGVLRAVTDGTGRRLELDYDSAKRLVAKRYPDGTGSTFRYDRVGRLVQATNNTISLVFAYDPEGNLVEEQQGKFKIRYVYDPMGRVTETRIGEANNVKYSYDLRGRLRSLVDRLGGTYTIHYDGVASTTVMQCPNDLVQSFFYSLRGRLSRHVVTHARAGELLRREYEYDLAGRISSVSSSKPKYILHYLYDALGQLRGVLRDGYQVEYYDYDEAGNVKSSVELKDLEYGPGNRLLRAGAAKYEYDPHGNVISRTANGEVARYKYDYENELIEVCDPEGRVTKYEYDPLMRRIRKIHDGVETTYRWSNDTPVQEETATGKTVSYIFFPFSFKPVSQIAGNQRYEYILDHLGAPIELVDASGTVWKVPLLFGGTQEADGGASSPFRFPGQYFDRETGLAYNRTRYYDPGIKRFLSQDRIRFAAGTNFYTYAGNNPFNVIDPLGLSCFRAECDQLFKDLNNLTNQNDPNNPPSSGGTEAPHGKGLIARATELENNDPTLGGMGLPYERLPGDPHGQRMTIASHWDQYLNIQRGVNNRLQEWDDLGCQARNTSDPTRAGRVLADARYNATLDPPIPDYVGDPVAMFGLPV
jgi:RHS repeat-associated protein